MARDSGSGKFSQGDYYGGLDGRDGLYNGAIFRHNAVVFGRLS